MPTPPTPDRSITKIIGHKEIAKHTFMVEVERPEGFEYKAGQFVALGLLKPKHNDPKGNYRWFSLASAPFEATLKFVFRKSDSPFKEQLLKLRPGEKVEISAPKGEFVLPKETDREIIFLTGGVGITPVRSMITQALHEKTGHKLTLFYSNFTPEETTFFQDLLGMEKEINVVCTMTGVEHSKQQWEGETTLIDMKMVKKYVKDIPNKLFYIVGPPGFLTAMIHMLREEKIDFHNIKLESFGGY